MQIWQDLWLGELCTNLQQLCGIDSTGVPSYVREIRTLPLGAPQGVYVDTWRSIRICTFFRVDRQSTFSHYTILVLRIHVYASGGAGRLLQVVSLSSASYRTWSLHANGKQVCGHWGQRPATSIDPNFIRPSHQAKALASGQLQIEHCQYLATVCVSPLRRYRQQ
jgi:hypothetical protein